MKKKIIVITLCLLTLMCSMFALSSCKDEECTHEWGEWSVSVPSTCSTQGTKQRKCSLCEEFQTDYIDIAEHDYDTENIVWTWNGYESATATLSCITDSTHTRQINANITDEVTSAPTCTATGTKTYTATVKIDGVTYTATKNETLTALGHTEVTDAAVAATCKQTGLTEGSHCSVCKEVLIAQQETPKAAHTETKIEAVAATCSAEGATEGKKCSVCDEILVAPQPTGKVAHTKETIPAVVATCEKAGLTEGKKCSVCKEILVAQTETELADHTEEIVPAVKATCSENGLTEGKKCSICNEVLVAQQPTDKLSHTETTLLGVAPSCSEEGLTEGKKCSVCGTVTLVQEPIDKLPHTEETVGGKAPTCSATGLSDGKKCSVCKETLVAQTILPKTACNYESVVTAPTCEAQGYTTHTCSMCKDSFVDTYVEKLGHKWGAWEISGSYTLRNCINDCECGKYQRITSINATYNGIRLLTGESVWKNDVVVTATLSDNITIDISDFALENDVMTVDGSNYVTVKFHSLSTAISVPAIYNNLPGVTSSIEFTYDETAALKNDAVTITGFVGSSTEIVIPSYIVIQNVRVPVRTIADYAFSAKENIKSVVVPDSITYIGTGAFNNCKRMTTLTLGKGLTEIACGAFYNCISLTEVEIPANVLTLRGSNSSHNSSYIDRMGAFENCTSLKKVTIGDTTSNLATTVIGYYTFNNCTALEEVYIGNKVKTIQHNAFDGCTALKNLTIGTSVQTIEDYAFRNCESIVNLVIPDSITYIGIGAFNNCKRMTTLTLGKGLTTIGQSAFTNCISLLEINIPTNVITIGDGGFENCTSIKKVTIGNTTSDLATTVIGIRAFQNCTALEEVYIGNKVKTIQHNAFNGCTALKTLTIGTSVQTIEDYAFSNCESIVNLVIPDSVTYIGIGAFNNCKRMTTLTLGKGLTEIACGAFYNCISLTEVEIPANVLTLRGSNSSHNSSYIDRMGAFENCTSLKKVTIGDNTTGLATTVIGHYAFYNCTALEEVYIGNQVKAIQNYSFAYCTSLETVDISDSVQEIGSNAFEGCVMLENFNIGTDVKNIGAYALANCTDLNSITIPGNVMTLGNNIFNNCTALEDVTIVSGRDLLRSFGSNIFNGCSSLDRIYFTGTAEKWAEITINSNNVYPLSVTPYFYSENQPSAVGDYWYYNGSGAKRVWNVTETAFKAEYSSENFVDLFGGESSSYATLFYNNISNDSNFMSNLYTWEALNVVANSSLVDGVWKVSKKDIYKVLLYDLLCGNVDSQEDIYDSLEYATLTYTAEFIKEFAGEIKSDDVFTIPASAVNCAKLTKYGIVGLEGYFERAETLHEALEDCAREKAFSDMDVAFQMLLMKIANDSSAPQDLRDAARECAELYQTVTQEIYEKMKEDAEDTATNKAIVSTFAGIAWDWFASKAFPGLSAAQLAAKGILLLANMGYNVDDVNMSFYKLSAAVKLEAALRNIIEDTLPDYFRISNRTNAENYVYAVDMYKTSVLLGFDYSIELLRADSETKVGEEKAEYEIMMMEISAMQQQKQELYNSFDNLVSQAYAEYYA